MTLPKTHLLLYCLLAGALLPFLASAQPERPNVLVIITDDQGFGDFGFLGNEKIQTPNMNRLSDESARFENFIVHAACSPTRSSFMTGRHHLKTGVWGVGGRNAQWGDEILMPAFFKAVGYPTGYFGKRDGIYTVELEGWERGIDEASHVTGYVHKDARSITHRGPVQREGWTVDHDVDLSLDFIERRGDGPWWVTTAFILPHLPWEAADEFIQPYRERGYGEELAAVLGCVSQVDAALGRLLRGLDKLGQAENTIVVFFSDNGPSFKGLDDQAIAIRNPCGFKGAKASIYEHGVRSPLLVRWPGRVEPGPREQFVTVEDLLPTLITMAALNPETLPEHLPFDGMDVSPAILDPAVPELDRTRLLVTISGPGSAGTERGLVNDPLEPTIRDQHLALRGPRFKWHNFHDGKTALYDIDNDPGETTDVSEQFPEIAARYEAELDTRFQEILSTGRAYNRPTVKVGQKQRGYNKIFSAWARHSTESLSARNFFFIEGFDQAGEEAVFQIDVQDPGTYDLELTGLRLERADGWQVTANGETFEPTEIEPKAVRFAGIRLPEPGLQEVAVAVTGNAAAGAGKIRLDQLQFHLTR